VPASNEAEVTVMPSFRPQIQCGLAALSIAGPIAVPAAESMPALSAPAGVGPLIDAQKTLATRMHFDIDTWFVTGHAEADGHTLSYFYHVIIMPGADGKPVIQSVVSLVDQTAGWFRSGDIVQPFTDGQVSKTGVKFTMPNGELDLATGQIHVKAHLADGSFDLHLQPASPVLYYGGTGVIPLLGMTLNEYAIPQLKSSGTLTIQGKTYSIDGTSWLDREWQNGSTAFGGKKWTWMSLNLDNGDAIMVYSTSDETAHERRAWSTVLHRDGSQTTTAVEPGLGATDEWLSAKSGNRYPTRWSVRIPALKAVLNVIPSPRRQEIVSVIPVLTKYEGASAVTGTVDGKSVKGFGYVEQYGSFK
jgi:predicted secreted hydrolase